jgi:hypothetical protein
MSTVSYGATTSATLSSIWRKAQGKLRDAINMKVEEFKWLSDLQDAKLVPTTREMLVPARFRHGYGIAAISEGAGKAVPSTYAPTDLSFTLNHYQGRFSIPRRIMLIDTNGGGDAQIKQQLAYMALDKLSGFTAYLGDSFYRPSSAISAQSSTAIGGGASTTFTLSAGFAQSWITNATYLANLFQINDRVRLYRDDTKVQVANAVGAITAKSTTTPSITITWDGSVPADVGQTYDIVLANSIDNTQDDYNKGISGNLIDILTAPTLHGLATSTESEWAAAYTDTTGGRFNGPRLMKGLDEIENLSPFEADTVIMAKGVHRDVVSNYQGSLRFMNPMAMQIDGKVEAEGVEFKKSRRVPPGFVATFASDAWGRFFGKPDVEQELQGVGYGDLDESEDYDRLNGEADWVGNLVCTSRRAFSYWRSLTEIN